MKYLRCRCGKHTAWSSYGTASCEGCPDCNTTLAEYPGGHRVPVPHDYEPYFDIDHKTGETKSGRQCLLCYHIEWDAQ